MLYIVPLIALVIGAVVGNALGTFFPLGVDPNLLSAIFGVFFMIGSFLIIRVGSGALRAEKFMPEIVTVLPPEE
jgi:sigma-E factor negative regulatory protein RseC